jgi:hypothetical protein
MVQPIEEALQWLKDRGGDGALVGPAKQQVLAQGEVGGFAYTTWKKLINSGRIEIYRLGNSKRLRGVK